MTWCPHVTAGETEAQFTTGGRRGAEACPVTGGRQGLNSALSLGLPPRTPAGSSVGS